MNPTDARLHELGVVTGIGPVRDHVAPVAIEIAERWPLNFVWGAPGRGTGDHARGLALDFMTYELGDGVDEPGPVRDWVGSQIAAYVLANRRRLNVSYVIWRRRIASAVSEPPWSWRPYTGDNPHTDHVHVSFRFAGTYTPPPTVEGEDPMTPEEIEQVAQRSAELVWFERLRNPAASPEAVPPHASAYLVATANEIDGLKDRLEAIEQKLETDEETPT